RLVGKAFLEIRGDRKLGGLDDRAAVRQRLVTRDHPVAASEDASLRAAGCGERLEAQARENARGAGIPWVRNEERLACLVQRAEPEGLVVLGHRHEELLAQPPTRRRWCVAMMSATQAVRRSANGTWRNSFGPCALDPGPPVPVMKNCARGKRSPSIAMKG